MERKKFKISENLLYRIRKTDERRQMQLVGSGVSLFSVETSFNVETADPHHLTSPIFPLLRVLPGRLAPAQLRVPHATRMRPHLISHHAHLFVPCFLPPCSGLTVNRRLTGSNDRKQQADWSSAPGPPSSLLEFPVDRVTPPVPTPPSPSRGSMRRAVIHCQQLCST